MTNRKALFFDIDGTIFDGKTKSVLPSTLKALETLAKNPEFDLYLSTGRSSATLGKINDYLYLFKGLNLSNGQEIYIDQKLIRETYIRKNDIKNLLIKSREFNTPLGLITNDDIVINFYTEESAKHFTTFIKSDVKILNDEIFDLNKGVHQVWLFATNEQIDQLQELFDTLDFLKWGSYGADVIPSDSSKAEGIKFIQSIMGYETCNMYAFGDGDNDVKMFKAVGTSVAMNNGSKNAKEAATFVTDNIDEDGLYKAILKLKFIEE